MTDQWRPSIWIGLVAFGLGCIGGAVALSAIRDLDHPVEELAERPPPLLVPIGSGTTTSPEAVAVVESWSVPTSLSLGGLAGRVTGLPSDGVLVMGHSVVELDGIERPGLQSDGPLWRTIEYMDSGEDVDAVASLLVELDFLDDAEALPVESDVSFRFAVREFETAFGWRRTGDFRPEYVVWIGPEEFDVGTYDVAVGDFVFAEAQLATGPVRLTSAYAVSLLDGRRVTLESGPFVLEVGDLPPVELTLTGFVSTESDLDLLGSAIRSGRLQRTDMSGLTGRVRLAESIEFLTAPSSAVLASATGETCLIRQAGSALQIEVIGGSRGVTAFHADAVIGDLVQSEPDVALSCR